MRALCGLSTRYVGSSSKDVRCTNITSKTNAGIRDFLLYEVINASNLHQCSCFSLVVAFVVLKNLTGWCHWQGTCEFETLFKSILRRCVYISFGKKPIGISLYCFKLSLYLIITPSIVLLRLLINTVELKRNLKEGEKNRERESVWERSKVFVPPKKSSLNTIFF